METGRVRGGNMQLTEKILRLGDEYLVVKEIRPKGFFFDDRALLKCFYCEKYGRNHRCPPALPKLDYRKLITSCKHAMLLCYKRHFVDNITDSDRRFSSEILHHAVLDAEKILWDNNEPLAISFIGGSCKLCGPDCPGTECQSPQKSRIMLEAIGVDITKTAAKVGVEIVYPPKGHFWRVGAVLW